MPPDTKIKLVSTQTPNQFIFDPHTKRSQFWSPNWNQLNADPPHWKNVYFDQPHNNQVNFDANTKTMSFSGSVTSRVTYTSTYSCYTAAMRMIVTSTQLALVLTFPYYSKTPKILRKYILRTNFFLLHRILRSIHYYVWYWLPDFVTFHSTFT